MGFIWHNFSHKWLFIWLNRIWWLCTIFLFLNNTFVFLVLFLVFIMIHINHHISFRIIIIIRTFLYSLPHELLFSHIHSIIANYGRTLLLLCTFLIESIWYPITYYKGSISHTFIFLLTSSSYSLSH